MLVRYLRVLHVSFWCLELCVFLFNCLLYAPWAHLRRGAQRPHYYYYAAVEEDCTGGLDEDVFDDLDKVGADVVLLHGCP